MKRAFFFCLSILILQAACSRPKDLRTATAANSPYAELKQADQLLMQRKCPEAIGVYSKFLEKYPKDAGGHNALGVAYLCNRQPQEAVASFQEALSLAPTFTDVHNNLGIAYMELKSYQEARGHFMKALEDPQFPTAGPYFNLAKLAYLEGSYEESRALAKKVLEFTPKESAPRLLYGRSLQMLNRYDEAASQYREILKSAPNNVDACYNLATVLVHQNHPCEAREFFVKVVDSDPLSELGQKSIDILKTLQCTKPAN